MKKKLVIILFAFLPVYVCAQEFSNLKARKLILTGDTLLVDSLSIVPGTLRLFNQAGQLIPDSAYQTDYAKSQIMPHKKLKGQTVTLMYRHFPYSFTKPYFHNDFSKLKNLSVNSHAPIRFEMLDGKSFPLFENDGLTKSGSLSRGISFGNNQDVIVNSVLNLQMSGKISNNLNLAAAISDNNIPIQPDGYSQQIQDFDKVYISIYNDNLNLTAGDFELESPAGYFMNLYKKSQGIKFSATVKTGKESLLKTIVSGAISKGKYNRMLFNGQENNQGPYLLTGVESETNIIVLSGTEKVYIDGKLMKRGQDNDYTIDYNSAQITFTAHQLITKDKRIAVEFEYSDKNYARFLIFNANEFQNKAGRFWLNLYSEQDSKNQPLQQNLTQAEKQILHDAGDNSSLAVVPDVDSIEYNNNEVLYRRCDSIVAGILYHKVFVYSTNRDSAHFRLGFSYAGSGNGDYVQIASSANGKVYKWIAPVNGIRQGDYSPVVQLIAPQKKQMLTFGGETRLSPFTRAGFEAALSNNDVNTFSEKDKQNDLGFAYKISLLQDILTRDTTQTRLNTGIKFQHINKNFTPVERIKTVEYERDWNLSTSETQIEEDLLNCFLNFKNRNQQTANYSFDLLGRGNNYRGTKHVFSGSWQKNGFELTANGSLLNTKDNINKTTFLRHTVSLSKQLGPLKAGIIESTEDNRWKSTHGDTLTSSSAAFREYEYFITRADSDGNKIFASYKNRKDFLPASGNLKLASTGHDFNLGFEFLKNPGNTLKTSFTYRKIILADALLSNETSENTVLGRIENRLRFYKGLMNSSTFYEVGSGVQLKQEFSYVEVAQGQGVYTWNDYNHNGVKELNEFEVATFQDQASYIRVYVPTNQYIRTFSHMLNQTLSIQPQKIWYNKKGLRKFATRFSDMFAYRIDRKNLRNNLWENINPFSSTSENELVNMNYSLRNTLSFNQSNPVYGIDYILNNNRSQILLSNGIDSRNSLTHGINIRLTPFSALTLLNSFDAGHQAYTSEYFPGKNFSIHSWSNELSAKLYLGTSLQTDLSATLSGKRNIAGEKSLEKNLGLELKINIPKQANISAKGNYIYYNFNSDSSTSLAYEMLQGLQPGSNATWTVLLERSLINGLDINFIYNGRASKDSKVVHTGSVQARINF
ncbi:MAG: hypothetical protein Q8907_08175 [Bacteroidota bacterium]|nr:hypothetical protein [Bacteroidota bacterium]